MLALHWANGQRCVGAEQAAANLVRLNFPSALLDEAYTHLHRYLTASALGRRLLLLPFNRDVQMTEAHARAMRAALQHCQKVGGIALVAPEHRASLQLKWHELCMAGGKDAEVAALDRLAALPYLDILDESDDLLHHRFQLIYACGARSPLPSLTERLVAIQAILHVMSKQVDDPHSALRQPGVAVFDAPEARHHGAFCGLRLLHGDVTEKAMPVLLKEIATRIVRSPPYDLRWMKAKVHQGIQGRMLCCILDDSKSALHHLGNGHSLADDQVLQLLALRGMLAGKVLMHCLQKRHLVEFGINRLPNAKKQLAVPFRAALTLSERSEYAQPDVALVLTHLAYYSDGLSPQQLLDAVKKLLSMGRSAQDAFFKQWLKLSWDTIAAGDRNALDKAEKLDPENARQLELLHKYFSHNMATVDFWLTFCVLPAETRQYSQRLTANSWHLADSMLPISTNGSSDDSSTTDGNSISGPDRTVVGFSGTNDNHRLLPLMVKQAHVMEPHLMGTNGKMLDVVLRDTHGFSTLQVGDGSGERKPLWQRLLDLAVDLNMHALVDCGALLAGPSNKGAAAYLLTKLDSSTFKGVCYYDSHHRQWMISEPQGRCQPRGSSPVAEADAFVLYDEARCRGADLQLQPNAVGLLSLGPATCKDKLMQAAGRLRLLGRGQTLQMVASSEVTAKIQRLANANQHAEPSTQAALRWVMHNTVQATLHGITQWSRQGLFFATTKGYPDRVLTDEVMDLHAMYEASCHVQPVSKLVKLQAGSARKRVTGSGPFASRMSSLVDDIVSSSAEHGKGHSCVSFAADEECEREVEREEEEEEEVERQVPRMKPATEIDWEYDALLRVRSPDELPKSAGVMRLEEGLVYMFRACASLTAIPWPKSMSCTTNFLCSVHGTHAKQMEYQRSVRALVLFHDGSVLLVSEREADAILELLWTPQPGQLVSVLRTREAPVLVSLPYLRQAWESGSPMKLGHRLVSAGSWQSASGNDAPVPQQLLPSLMSLQLFDGDTRFRTVAQKQHLHGLMRRKRQAAEELTSMRGKQQLLSRSDLAAACEDDLFLD
uniref:ubiquitinyl hydrolase 1 n=1 Tax=Chlamydomonas euryale TaxID=1486919 RepID=A0A7R9V0Q8_9CHLO|mmetsp:Transcript_13081/g.38021  ORF Transcript_13081/g.38021 Transcript_13081/m.38021 type:complete len:1058 (+) Transcript_13081:6150-9323(+)